MPLKAKKWIVWGIVLVLQLGAFLIAKLVLHKPALELAGPYLATFVAPLLIFMAVVMWLRKWETRKPSPRLLALCWSLAVAFLVAAVDGAIFYYGVRVHIMNPTAGEIIFVIAACVLSASIPTYHGALPLIIARAGRGDV